MRRLRVVLLVLLVPVALVLGIWLGGHPDDLPGGVRDTLVADSQGRLYNEAVDLIEDRAQHELDGLVDFSWVHTFNASTLLQVSPFYHYNRADYEPGLNDLPIATTSDRASNYAGLQGSLTGQVARNTLQGGVYGFGQHDSYVFGSVFNDGSATSFRSTDMANGGLVEEFVSDTYKAMPWLTLIGGLRGSHFVGEFTENRLSPRIGAVAPIQS